jgi:hypothetical protein
MSVQVGSGGDCGWCTVERGQVVGIEELAVVVVGDGGGSSSGWWLGGWAHTVEIQVQAVDRRHL